MSPDQQKTPLALIVDDDPVLRLLAREALESSGWNVEEAENGREALAIFQRLHPDVVLLDIMMPEMDGFTVCAALRKLPEGKHTPILIMTGQEDYNSIMQAYDAGATDFLTKPLNGLLLTHRVRYIVRSSRVLQDLRASQASLAQSERRLRLTQFAVDHAEDGVLWADDSKRFMYANEAACRLLGYSNEELLTLSISDIAPYQDPTRFQQRLDQIKQGTVATYESIHRRKDGNEFPVEASVSYLEHEGKGYTCGIVRDITERKRIEQERAQAMADLHNVMESIPDVVFALNTQGNLVKWNQRLVGVTGYSPVELLNKPALAFVPPEEQARTAAAIQRAFTEGYAELDGQLLTKDFRTIPYHWTGALLKNSHGEPVGITGVGRDVSDKRRAEEALRRSEERFALAVEGSTDILWDAHRIPGEPWYAPQTPIWWSPRVRVLLDLEESELFETLEQWAMRLHPDDKDCVFGKLAAHIEHRVPYDAEYRLRTNRGDYLWIRGRGQASWDEQGEIRRMSGSCQDITDRKRVEEERQKQEVLITLMLNTGPACIKRVAADGSLLHMNPTGLKLVEACGEPEVVGRSVFDLVTPEHRDAFIDMHRSVIEGHEHTLQFEIQSLKGTRRWMESYAAPFRNPVTGQTEQLAVTHDITGRKQVEEALRESETFNISVLNSLSSQIVVLDSQGVIMAVNKPWLRFAEENGAPHLVESFVGMSYLNVCAQAAIYANGEEAALAQAGILAVLACTQNEFSLEYPCHSPDQQRWFRMRVTPLLDSRVGVVVAHENITERKQAEEALRKSEWHFRAIFENTAVGIAFGSHTTGTGISEANPAFQSMTGYSLEELCCLGMKGLTYPGDLPASKAFVERLVSGALAHGTIEKRYLKKDGFIMWAQTTVSSILDEQGNYENSVAMIQDITERKVNELLLDAQKRVLEMIVTDAPLQEILTLICRTVEELSPRARCSILLLDRDGRHLRHGAAPRLPEAYVRAIDGVVIGPDVSSCGIAAFTRRQVIVPNIADDPFWTDYCDLALGHGLQACWSTPIISSDGTVLGTFAVYYGEPQQPTHGDLRLVERVAHFACIAIERKRTEEALQKSQERYAQATAAGKVGVWELDVVAGTYHGDSNLKKLFGYLGDELSTDPYVWLNLVHTDDRSIAMDHWQRIVNGEMDDYDYELRMLKKDGTVIWTDIRGHAVRDHEGQVTQLFGTTMDITDRKRAQDALAQSECQLRTVLDALPVGVWFTDRAGKPLLANPTAKQIWSNIKQIGLQTENHQANWSETIGPTSEPHRWALGPVLTAGVPSLNETFDLECLDGTKKIIRNSTVPVQDEAGNILGAIVLNEDITMLKQAQKALKLTQFSVDHAVEGFFWINQDARVMHVNEAACGMLEYTHDELTAMTVHDIDPNLSSELWPTHWDKLKEKGSITFETKFWSRTGRVLDTEVTVNYLQYEGNEYSCAIMRDIGERKRVQAALRASEERYRSLYDETPTMYFTLATDGTVLSVNRFGAEQLGYQVEELIGHSVLGLFHEDDKETVAASLSECLAIPETTRHWEFRKVRKDGSVIWVRETVHVGQSSSAETIVLVTGEDITKHRQMGQALRKSEHYNRILFESSPIGLVLCNLDGTIVDCNKKYTDILGRDLSDVLGKTYWELTSKEYDKQARAVMETVCRTGRFGPYEKEYVHADGRLVPVCLFGSLIEKDSELFIVSSVEDITERKRAEEDLRKSHAFIRQIIDTDPNFIFAKDREGRFTLVNKAVADAYGTTVDNLIGKTDADFNPNQEEVAFFRQKDLAVMDTLHELFLPEEVITDSGGRTHWLQTVKRPILDNEGRAIMVLGASTDITERKRMEETLRQRERDLRAAIEERERISQDLHDGILQSLFAVGLTLEASKLTMTPTARKTSGASLNKAIDQLNLVMREIRNFIAGLGSDLLQGKNLPAAIKHTLAILTENQPTHVRLALEDRAAKAVSVEQAQHLLLVIQEAVSNCIRHGRAQEARVSLRMLKRGVRLSVRDNGRGFKPGAVKKTGHGLANMAARAQKIGGRFTILSKVNKGTSIVLDLPNEVADVHR